MQTEFQCQLLHSSLRGSDHSRLHVYNLVDAVATYAPHVYAAKFIHRIRDCALMVPQDPSLQFAEP